MSRLKELDKSNPETTSFYIRLEQARECYRIKGSRENYDTLLECEAEVSQRLSNLPMWLKEVYKLVLESNGIDAQLIKQA